MRAITTRLIALLFISLPGTLRSQILLNGSFENTSAVGDQINLSNAAFNSRMTDCNGFGSYGDLDIITSGSYCGGAQDGNWYIALTGSGTDAVAMSLSSPFLAGVTYTVSFYDRGCSVWTPYPFDLGVSNDSASFGTSILTGTQSPLMNVWTQRSVTFTAPFTAHYLTMKLNGGGLGEWSHIDNVCINNCITYPVPLFTAPHHLCPGTCTYFNNLSTGATAYTWLFPGAFPNTSTETNPSGICYLTPGHYNVSLIATNSNGSDTITLTNYITVYPYSPSQSVIQSGDTLISNTGFVSYQWFQSGDTISGATSYYYVPVVDGDYSVVCIDNNGCSVEAVIQNVMTGLKEKSGSMELVIYPNPAQDQLQVRSSDRLHEREGEKPSSVFIYNCLGECFPVTVPAISEDGLITLDISSLEPGSYLLELSGPKGILRASFVKQ